MTTVLPTGVSQAALDGALEAFVAVLGADRVLVEPEQLAEFRDPFQPPSWTEYTPSAVVQPSSVEEVQAVVRIANEHRVPLWTHGQGRNNGYGGAAPRVQGAVTMSLRGMDRILEIDEDMGYAVVEPGVSWLQLHGALRDGGHRLMLSVPDLGWGSVVGNTLEHGTTYLPLGQDFQAACGMEVVTADGSLLRTGMGGVPGNESFHLYRRGLGPSLDGLFMQSNFGVVTRMGVWLEPFPEAVMPIWVTVPREDDLAPVLDTLRTLLMRRTLAGVPTTYNALVLATAMSKREQWFTGDGPIPEATIDRIASELGVGRWTVRMCVMGDDAVVDHHFATIKAAFERIPGATVRGEKKAPEDRESFTNSADQVVTGVPNLDWVKMAGWYGGEEGGHIGFSPVVPLRGDRGLELHRAMRASVERVGLDYTPGGIMINARSFINVIQTTFDTKDEAQARKAYDLARALVGEAAAMGYGEYRAHLDFMDLAASAYSFGDHAYLRFVEKIKDAVDPNGILAPGKQGIWPAHLRGS
jgi:4-cresol dehydrogenase (hydroxylating) flavoprotein subunit